MLKNVNKSSPWDFQGILLDEMINKYTYNYNKELEELANINEEMIIKRINKIIKFDNLPIITIIYGNIKKDLLKNIVTYNMNNNIKIDKRPKHNLSKLKTINFKNPNKDEVNNSVGYFFPIKMEQFNPTLTARLLILNRIMERPAFDELRTKAQLGYLVSCKVLYYSDLFILKITVQSAKEVKFIETKMNEFLELPISGLPKEQVKKLRDYGLSHIKNDDRALFNYAISHMLASQIVELEHSIIDLKKEKRRRLH
jgi:secreted Zn-dependent insulinase-like peptidase